MSESRFYHVSPAGKLTGVGSVAEALKTVARRRIQVAALLSAD